MGKQFYDEPRKPLPKLPKGAVWLKHRGSWSTEIDRIIELQGWLYGFPVDLQRRGETKALYVPAELIPEGQQGNMFSQNSMRRGEFDGADLSKGWYQNYYASSVSSNEEPPVIYM